MKKILTLLASASLLASVAFGAGNTYTGHLIGNADTAGTAHGVNATNTAYFWGLTYFGATDFISQGSGFTFDGGNIYSDGVGNLIASSFSGSGSGLTGIPLSGLQSTGTLNTTTFNANSFTVTNSGVLWTWTNGVMTMVSNTVTLTFSAAGLEETNTATGNYSQYGRDKFILSFSNNLTMGQTILSGTGKSITVIGGGNTNTFFISTNPLTPPTWNGWPWLTNVITTNLAITVTNTGNTNLANEWAKLRDVNGNFIWVIGTTNQP